MRTQPRTPTVGGALLLVSLTPWLPGIAFAGCDQPATVIDVIEATEASSDAYGNADLMGFIETTSELEALLPCLQEPLPRNMVANVHRMMGLRAFVDQKRDKADAAFGAARNIEPKYRFSETMVPPGHPIMQSYDALDLAAVTTKAVPKPAGGYLHIDGRPTYDRPVQLPTVVQLFNGEGGVEVTGYLWPADGMIEYAEGEPVAPPGTQAAPLVAEPLPVGRKGPNLPLLVGAGGSAVAATVLYGVGAASASAFHDPAAPYEDGQRLRARTNTFAIASGGAGVVALGLGVGAVVAGRW